MTISSKARKSIKGNQRLRHLLAAELGRHVSAIERWVEAKEKDQNNNLLTSVAAVKIIMQETGLTEDEILTEANPVQK